MASGRRVRPERLDELLGPQGYWLARHLKRDNLSLFSRPSSVKGCFEQIEITGDHGDVDSGCVFARVSIVPGATQYRGMFEDEFVFETSFRRGSRTSEWEKRIVEEAIPKSHEMAHQAGPELLRRTARAQEAAQFYLACLPEHIDNLEAHWTSQKREATDEQRAQAKHSLRTSVLSLDARDDNDGDRIFWTYQIAAYAIVLNSEKGLEAGFFAPGTDPHEEHDLAWCFQIMASRIYGEEGWKFMVGYDLLHRV